MLEIFLRTLPFFAIIGLGYGAGRARFFPAEATAYLTRFVFFFALSAMLFRFAATLPFDQIFDGQIICAYLVGTGAVYLLATGVAMVRGQDMATAAIEAQCAVIGNVGFLGIPMFLALFGDGAIGPQMMVLSIDLIVFSSLIVILINISREGRLSLRTLRVVGLGLVKNPMIVAISAGLLWSVTGWSLPFAFESFLVTLGNAATPGALFAIGASLAGKSAERLSVAGWISFCKLALHPAAVAVGALWLFPLDRFTATIVIGLAALPVAGNVYMLAQYYGMAVQRVSTAILISTILSVCSFPAILMLLGV
jgi:predicted permease